MFAAQAKSVDKAQWKECHPPLGMSSMPCSSRATPPDDVFSVQSSGIRCVHSMAGVNSVNSAELVEPHRMGEAKAN
jgi:hypothetical protein